MIMRFENRTNYPQQLNFIDGSSVKIPARNPANGYKDIDITTLYKDELERAKKFFVITPVEEKKTSPRRMNKGGYNA